jgi:hypothetical protein
LKSGSIIQAGRDFKKIYSVNKCLTRNAILWYVKGNKSWNPLRSLLDGPQRTSKTEFAHEAVV